MQHFYITLLVACGTIAAFCCLAAARSSLCMGTIDPTGPLAIGAFAVVTSWVSFIGLGSR